MSEYTDQSDDNHVICPYCGHSYQPESEDYDTDEREENCEECGKNYYLSQEFSVTHNTQPDCKLNGDEHDYKPIDLNGKKVPLCTVCGKCQPHRERI